MDEVKGLLYKNVKGRICGIIWNKIVSDYDNNRNALEEEDQMEYLYERTNYWYDHYKPLLDKMKLGDTIEVEQEKGREQPVTFDSVRKRRGRPKKNEAAKG